MPPFLLSCLTYLGIALPGSTLGMLWPSMRIRDALVACDQVELLAADGGQFLRTRTVLAKV